MNSNNGGIQYQNVPLPRAYDDEISLHDLIAPVFRQWRLVLLITTVFALAGLLIGVVTPKKYLYSATIEIGTRAVADGFRPIDQPQNVLAKITNGYIPLALHDYVGADDDAPDFKIKAAVPKQSDIITIDVKGTEEQGETLKLLLSTVIDKVRGDHERIQAMMRKEIEVKRAQMANRLASLEEQEKLTLAKAERLERVVNLTKKQLEGIKATAEQAGRNRRSVRNQGESVAMAMVLRDDDRAVQEQITKLEDRMELEIPGEKDVLTKEATENRFQQAEIKEEIAKLEMELKNFRETRAVIPPMRSLKPVGLGTTVIIVIAALLGFISAALLALFRDSAKKHQRLTYL